MIYNAEIAPAQIRGALLSTHALGNPLGGIVGTVALEILATVRLSDGMMLLTFVQSSVSTVYKRVLRSEFLLAALFILALFLVPE